MTYCPTCGAPLTPEANFCTACGTEIAGRVRYSGFWRRVGAYVLDALIIEIPLNLILAPTGLSTGARGLFGSLAFLLYGPTLILSRGQTVGMRVAKIVCRMVDGTKATLSAVYTRALVRVVLGAGSYLAYLIAPPVTATAGTGLTPAQSRAEQRFLGLFVLFAVPLIIDLLWMRRGSRKQFLHDLAGGTVMVRSELELRAPALPPLRP